MPTKDEIFTTVQEALVEALGVDEDEVTADSSLVEDLGAESIDMLDIIFRLEKGFEIKIDREELFPESLLKDPNYVQGGKITAEGMTELNKRMTFADLSDLPADLPVEDFFNTFKVKTICDYVEYKLAQAA